MITTQPVRTVPSASSHRLKLTPGHRRSTSLSTGSAEDTSSADSRTSTTSPPDSPRCNEETQITTTIEYSSPTGLPGRGMRNVIARVTVVGGHVSVHSEPGAGTRIDGWVPLPDQPTEASEGEAAAAGQQSADGVSSAGESASLITSADDTLVGKARDAKPRS